MRNSAFLAAAVPDAPGLAERLETMLRRLGSWAPVVFIGLFVAACVACLPTVGFAVAAGALWGLAWGLAIVWIGILLGSSAAFLLGRHVARRWVLHRLAGHPRLAAIEEAVSEEGWKIVVLARLAPGSPFFLLNYAFSLTRIGFWEHLWSTALAVLPGTTLFVYLGSIGQLALRGRIRTVWDALLLGVGFVALALGVHLVARRARRILDARLRRPSRTSDPSASSDVT